MDTILVLGILAITAITGLVGVAIWLSNQRAIEKMKQDNLNYREELRAGRSPSSSGSPDILTTLITTAMANPEMVNKLLGGLGQQQQATLQQQN